ncbi:MAG: carbon-nitrogen family hydrolase [Desulfobacteraceae bacterium]
MKVASIQMEITDRSKEENLFRAESLLEKAQGADLVVLPEVWNVGYFSFDRYDSESEPLEGETASRMSAAARRLGAYLHAGSWVVKRDGRLYNTSFLFDRRGGLAATYEKIHLFGYGSRERELLTRGTEPVVVRTELGAFGLTTCYDLRFPELYRRMMKAGAEVFLVASGWPYPRLEHWMMFNRVRALENVAYLISANCVGVNGGVRFCGHSMIVDPWGIAKAGGGDEEEILQADIDLHKVARIRENFTALNDIVFPV